MPPCEFDLIYRRVNLPGDPWVKLNNFPLIHPRYIDRAVANGTEYQYRVNATDNTVSEEQPGEARSGAGCGSLRH